MTVIRDLIGQIRKFSKDVINIKDYYRIKNWNEDQFVEYIENYDLNQEVIDIFSRIFNAIKKKIKDPTEKGCIDLQGNFGTGKSHILLFLAVILTKKKFPETVQEKIDIKLKENESFYEKFKQIEEVLDEISEGTAFSNLLIIPIRLLEFKGKPFDKIIELAVTRDILSHIDSHETLIPDVKNIYNFFDKELDKSCLEQIDQEELEEIRTFYGQLKNGKNINITLI